MIQTYQDDHTMPRRAYPYGRTSFIRHSQHKSDSQGRQTDFAAEIAQDEGWCLDDTYHFADAGRSGFHGDHLGPKGDLTRFLGMVRAKRITPGSVLIIEQIDRLSRQEVDVAYDVFREILKAGIWIATKQPRRVYKRENCGLMDLMEPIWLMYLAHEESAKKSMRLLDKWERRRRRAQEQGTPHGRRCRSWLRLTPNGYELIPERAETIHTIFRLATMGYGLVRIAQYLNARPGQHPPFGRAKRWLGHFILSIIRGRAVLGEHQQYKKVGRKRVPDGSPLANYYPAVITEDEWLLAQAALSGRKHQAGRPGRCIANLFTGLVREATTRRPMSTNSRSGSNDRCKAGYRYIGVFEYGRGCRKGCGMSYQQFEHGILRRIGSLETIDVLPADATRNQRDARIAELTTRQVILDQRSQEIEHQLGDPDNAAAVATLTKALTKLAAEKQAIDEELRTLKLDSLTGRGEALAETQTIIQMLAEARGTKEEEPLRQKLKASIRWVVQEIWLLVQPVNQRRCIGHAQIYLRNGARRYVQLFPTKTAGPICPWQLDDCDFRAGDIGEATTRTAAPQLVHA